MVEKYNIVVPSSIVRREAKYFKPRTGEAKVTINLLPSINNNSISELTAEIEELAAFYRLFDSVFLESMDPGESEALASILSEKISNALFCTSDGPAIQALSMIGNAHLGISFESALKKIGLARKIEGQFTEEFFQYQAKQGHIKLITREGFAN